MPYIIDAITLQDIKDEKPEVVYYAYQTCWWTHRRDDLRTLPNGLPCDPLGSVLLAANAEEFIANAESQAEHYGKHGLTAFIAAHNDNCVVSKYDTRNTSLQSWDEYNDLIDLQNR